MNMNKLTVKAQEAVQQAQQLAANHTNQAIEPLHLLAALMQDAGGIVVPVLAKAEVRTEFLTEKVMQSIAAAIDCITFSVRNSVRTSAFASTGTTIPPASCISAASK